MRSLKVYWLAAVSAALLLGRAFAADVEESPFAEGGSHIYLRYGETLGLGEEGYREATLLTIAKLPDGSTEGGTFTRVARTAGGALFVGVETTWEKDRVLCIIGNSTAVGRRPCEVAIQKLMGMVKESRVAIVDLRAIKPWTVAVLADDFEDFKDKKLLLEVQGSTEVGDYYENTKLTKVGKYLEGRLSFFGKATKVKVMLRTEGESEAQAVRLYEGKSKSIADRSESVRIGRFLFKAGNREFSAAKKTPASAEPKSK